MVKTIGLNEMVYTDLVKLSGRLTVAAGKPISLGMAVYIAVTTLENTLDNNPELKANIEKILRDTEIATPEQFDAAWDSIYHMIESTASSSRPANPQRQRSTRERSEEAWTS